MYPNLNFGAPQTAPGMGSFSGQSLNWGQPAASPAGYAAGIGGYGMMPLPGPSAPALASPMGSSALSSRGPAIPVPGTGIAPAAVTATTGAAVPEIPGAEAPGGIMGGLGGMFKNDDGSWNMSAFGDVAKGIGAFGSLYMGFQQNAQASEALDFQKKAYQTNLKNTTTSYNTALEDRINSRMAQQGGTDAEAAAYINKHKMGR